MKKNDDYNQVISQLTNNNRAGRQDESWSRLSNVADRSLWCANNATWHNRMSILDDTLSRLNDAPCYTLSIYIKMTVPTSMTVTRVS